MCESKVRQPQVGDVYDVRVMVKERRTRANGKPIYWLRVGDDILSVFVEDFLPHATLVKAAERPFKVGDSVKYFNDTPLAPVLTIKGVDGDQAWVRDPAGNRWTAHVVSLRHADEAGS